MLSVFDLFKIGIGPSSSHTVGPMKAAYLFTQAIIPKYLVTRIKVQLHGSLGSTGKGHGSDTATLLGLLGFTPETINPDHIQQHLTQIRDTQHILLNQQHPIAFNEKKDLLFYRQALPQHPNGITLSAYVDDTLIHQDIFFSIGGGFIIHQQDFNNTKTQSINTAPHPFHSAQQLLAICQEEQTNIANIMRRNELARQPESELTQGLENIWQTMQSCIERGMRQTGELPGGLKLLRRAPLLHQKLMNQTGMNVPDPLLLMDWVNLFALAVSEENAAGSRVVTAPTNGAAGIIPAVINYYRLFVGNASKQGIENFLLTAAAIGILYKLNASISGAEVGCQGEVGVASSMAAAGLCAVLGGTPNQVENAAEIAMEHHLGMTCDPIGGLVQIPCIERNAMGAIKAINAARMALHGDGTHYVSLDKVIKTMRETGADMKLKYKETARGGLAVNIVDC